MTSLFVSFKWFICTFEIFPSALEHVNDKLALSGDVKYDGKGALLNASALYSQANYLIGGSIAADQTGPIDWVAGAGYSKPSAYEVSAHM